MSNVTRLDNVAHAGLRVAAGHGAAFGDAVNQIALFLPEFEEAQRHYPILFRRQDSGSLQAVAILGFDRDENLFLEGDRWAAYVPAIARRGPFLIGLAGDEPMIHVDFDHPRVVGDAAEGGEPLFLPQGGQAPALDRAVEALRAIHLGHEAAPAMTALFDELELVRPVTLNVQVSDSQSYNFKDYLAIAPERIAALGGAGLERLNQAGLLPPAIFAASSLANMNRLIARKHAAMA
jgi:SapC protein